MHAAVSGTVQRHHHRLDGPLPADDPSPTPPPPLLSALASLGGQHGIKAGAFGAWRGRLVCGCRPDGDLPTRVRTPLGPGQASLGCKAFKTGSCSPVAHFAVFVTAKMILSKVAYSTTALSVKVGWKLTGFPLRVAWRMTAAPRMAVACAAYQCLTPPMTTRPVATAPQLVRPSLWPTTE